LPRGGGGPKQTWPGWTLCGLLPDEGVTTAVWIRHPAYEDILKARRKEFCTACVKEACRQAIGR
jgi:hypothetical protein